MVMFGHGLVIGRGPVLGQFAVAGVSLFFVLSGFLITRILIRSVERANYFQNFYLRRVLRIWPLYFLILGIAFLTPLFYFSHAVNPGYRYALYIQNFWSMDDAPPILRTTWSLAIEEQFYLVWPLVVWLCNRKKRLGYVAIALIVVTPIIRVLYHLHGIDPYDATFGRMDGLAMGAALGVLSIAFPGASLRNAKFLAGCMAFSVALIPLLHYTLLRKAFKDTSTSLLFVSMVGTAFYWSGSKITRILRSSVLRYFGRISYCAYLIHMALFERFSFVPAFALIVVVASLSWYMFENPILLLKDRVTRPDPV